MTTFTTFTSPEYGFQIDIPADWKLTVNRRKARTGFFGRLVDAFSERSVFIALLPEAQPGFARMGVEVRTADQSSLARQQVDHPSERRTVAGGLPAIEAKYTTAGTRFCKVAVINDGREYIIQFGHDGALSDDLIEEMVHSFKFI